MDAFAKRLSRSKGIKSDESVSLCRAAQTVSGSTEIVVLVIINCGGMLLARDTSPSPSPNGGTSSQCRWMRCDVVSLDPNPDQAYGKLASRIIFPSAWPWHFHSQPSCLIALLIFLPALASTLK